MTILSAACLATCLSSFSWGRSGQSLPLQQETTFSNLISNNVLGKVSKSDIKMKDEAGFFECSPGLELAPFLSKDAISLSNPLPALLSS